jgi:ABC-type transporter Mla subunit MlaD
MRASEILRQLADAIDKVEAPVQEFMEPEAQVAQVTVIDEPQINSIMPTNQEPQSAQDGATMASPLQQELEIMKKAAGILSAFDGHQQ